MEISLSVSVLKPFLAEDNSVYGACVCVLKPCRSDMKIKGKKANFIFYLSEYKIIVLGLWTFLTYILFSKEVLLPVKAYVPWEFQQSKIRENKLKF